MPSEPISEPTAGQPTSGQPVSGQPVRRGLLLAGCLGTGLAGVALTYRLASGGPVLEQGWSVLAILALWWVVFGVGATMALRLPTRTALVVVLVFGVVMRIVALAGPPVMSDDLYRYAWDARVQAAGVNPYKYPPAAPELAYLHEPWLWPDAAGCAQLNRGPGCTRTNRDRDPTIYPPLAQAWFWAVDAVLPSHARERGWQAAAGVVDVALLGVVVLALRSLGRDPRYVVLYAWSPIAVIETAQSAHVDGLAALGIVGAVWAAHRGRNALAGGLLAAATLVKLYPALLLPVLLRRRPIRTLAAFAALGVAAYAPHVIALGPKVIGYLPGYLSEERYDTGGRFLLLGLTGLSGLAAQVVAVMIIAVGACAAWAVARDGDGDVRARCLLGGALLLITPVQPWYALALVAIAALGGAWWWLAVAVAGYPIYLDAILGNGRPEAVGRLSYGLAALAVAVSSWRMRTSRSSKPPALTSADAR